MSRTASVLALRVMNTGLIGRIAYVGSKGERKGMSSFPMVSIVRRTLLFLTFFYFTFKTTLLVN